MIQEEFPKMNVYPKDRNLNGKLGSNIHQDIINWTYDSVAKYIGSITDHKWAFVYEDLLMSYILTLELQWGNRYGLVPDALWIYEDGLILIEIGNCLIDKWPNDMEVIHISFDAKVSMLNVKNDATKLIADEIQYMALYDDNSPFKNSIIPNTYKKTYTKHLEQNRIVI